MYEYERSMHGLGWSDYVDDGRSVPCEHVVGGIKKCFTTTEADRVCAENSNCFELQGAERESCQTTSGGRGYLWCCSRNLPPPPGNPCVRQPLNLSCRIHDMRCSDFVNNDEYQTCRIKKELCNVGIDPGPIDGNSSSNMLHVAIRMFKARNQISPINESVTPGLIRALGLNNDSRVQPDDDTPSGPGVVPQVAMQIFWPFAFSVSSSFLMYALWKYRKRNR